MVLTIKFAGLISILLYFYGRILKANLSWSPTRAKFFRLIARLFVILSTFYLTKLKLEYLKFGVKCKKE